jgi:ParB-like chromosome segregation protein Spo0J
MTDRSRGQRPLDDLKIVFLPISSLKPNPRNARTHTRRQIRKIAHCIRALGFNCPIIIDDEENVLAGNAVLKAAESIGMTDVPTMRLSHMSEAEKRGFVISHNRLAEEAGWDRSLLAVAKRRRPGDAFS